MSVFQDGELPNAYKGEHPLLTQSNLKEIYKQRICEYMYIQKDDLNCMQRYAKLVPLDSSTKCLSAMINYIWGSYVYHMGQTNYWWKTSPPPPLLAPVWLEEYLKPILSKWIDAALSSSG
jgi:hypothetical protein